MLRDEANRHYIGVTSDLEARLGQHRSGGTRTTRLMKGELVLVAARSFSTRQEANIIERKLKRWKNPSKALAFLTAIDAG
jgi:predicted GIY-YIG superfamily endonuclease